MTELWTFTLSSMVRQHSVNYCKNQEDRKLWRNVCCYNFSHKEKTCVQSSKMYIKVTDKKLKCEVNASSVIYTTCDAMLRHNNINNEVMWLTAKYCRCRLYCPFGILNPESNRCSIEQCWCDGGLIMPPPPLETFWL